MSGTEAKDRVSFMNDSDAEEAVYRLNVTMADTPSRQPINAFVIALRNSLCSHADYLYFGDLSHCGQEPNHIPQQVRLSSFNVLK